MGKRNKKNGRKADKAKEKEEKRSKELMQEMDQQIQSELTQVNSCGTCNLKPIQGCVDGLIPVHPESPSGSVYMCPHNKKYRNEITPLPTLSAHEKELPPSGRSVTLDSDLAKSDGSSGNK